MAKKQSEELYVTSTGFKVRFKTVPYVLITALANTVEEPRPPAFYNESKQEWQENPLDPKYLAAKDAAEALREKISSDALFAFGVELVEDEVPDPEEFMPHIKKMDAFTNGKLLEGYDLSNEDILRALYMRMYVLPKLEDIFQLNQNAFLKSDKVRKSLDSFRDSA